MSSLRTFIAIETSLEVRGHLARLVERMRRVNAKVKWVATDNVHLTLKFLGDVPEAEIADVCRSVKQAVVESKSFLMEIRGAGAFPNSARPRTVWIGVGQGAEQVSQIQGAVEGALKPLGFPREGRRYRPHLTLGRVRGGGSAVTELGQQIDALGDFEAGGVLVEEVVIFASELTADGPIYTPLARVPLD